MKIKLYFFGKSREISSREKELVKRIGFRAKIELIAISQAGINDSKKTKSIEADNFLKKINEKSFVVAFDEYGKNIGSLEFSRDLKNDLVNYGEVIFIIGGAYGLGEDVLTRVNKKISFGKMVWTRNLVRHMALEQIYRAMEIDGGTNFHKE
jgi:23S rRNA (pseudouridine1915-N3)-methyltransferase